MLLRRHHAGVFFSVLLPWLTSSPAVTAHHTKRTRAVKRPDWFTSLTRFLSFSSRKNSGPRRTIRQLPKYFLFGALWECASLQRGLFSPLTSSVTTAERGVDAFPPHVTGGRGGRGRAAGSTLAKSRTSNRSKASNSSLFLR